MTERDPFRDLFMGDDAEPEPIDAALAGGPEAAAVPPGEPLPHETAHLPEVAPDAAAAPAWDPLATQAMSQVDEPTVALPATPGAGRPAAPPPTSAPTAATTALPTEDSALDALFGENSFREYRPGLDPAQAPFAARAAATAAGEKPERRGPTKAQKVLLWVAGSVLAVLALIALFLVGLRLPELTGSTAEPTPSPTPSVATTPEPLAVGPVEPGVYAWDELLGGECLDPFVDPWQEEFTVVDCAAEHPAQLVFRGFFPEVIEDPFAEFPGEEALQAQISLLCSAPGVVDLAAAGAYSDAQFQGSYPITAEQWDENPTYYCFVNRSSGEPLTGSVAVAPTPPAS